MFLKTSQTLNATRHANRVVGRVTNRETLTVATSDRRQPSDEDQGRAPLSLSASTTPQARVLNKVPTAAAASAAAAVVKR